METGELRQVLEAVVTVLDDVGVSYHVTGGLASSFYGEPRLTQDVDFVVRVTPSEVTQLATRLSDTFLVDLETTMRAAKTGGMFQALHKALLIKADFHVGEDVPGSSLAAAEWSSSRGSRSGSCPKEDAILSKLLWVKQGSSKSRGDVLGMLLDPTPFDHQLLNSLAEELGCADLLREIRSSSDD